MEESRKVGVGRKWAWVGKGRGLERGGEWDIKRWDFLYRRTAWTVLYVVLVCSS